MDLTGTCAPESGVGEGFLVGCGVVIPLVVLIKKTPLTMMMVANRVMNVNCSVPRRMVNIATNSGYTLVIPTTKDTSVLFKHRR